MDASEIRRLKAELRMIEAGYIRAIIPAQQARAREILSVLTNTSNTSK